MNKDELKQLIKNTNLFDSESRLPDSLSNTTAELKSVLSYEIEHMPKDKIKEFTSNLLDYYKEEILNQDKIIYRTIITEIDKSQVKYLVVHRHPKGNFISELDENTFVTISTIGELLLNYYDTKNKMLADLIIKNCFRILYNPKENEMQINISCSSVEKLFSNNILQYIKVNIKEIANELANHNTFLNYHDENRYDMFREFLNGKLKELFLENSLDMELEVE